MRRWRSFWRRNVGGLRRAIVTPVQWLFGVPIWIGRLLAGWWSHRRFRYLVRGLPTVAVAALCGYMAVNGAVQPASVLALTYSDAARRAMNAGQFESAKLYYKRVIELDAADEKALFDLARAAYETEDFVQMTGIMNQLAPDDRAVYADAHLWKAEQHYRSAHMSLENLRAAENHLLHALSLRPEDVRIQIMLGELYFRSGVWNMAVRFLSPWALDHPNVRLSLAKAYSQIKEEDRARRWGEQALDHYSERAADDPRDLQTRLDWADSLMFLERFQESSDLLRQTMETHIAEDDQRRLRWALARVYTAWAESFDNASDPGNTIRFRLLSQALLLSPQDYIIFDHVFGLLRANSGASDQVRDFLLDNIAAGRAVAVSHLILGSNAIITSDSETAAFHLNRAFEISPTAPAIANNLAWYLAVQADPPQPQRALEIITPIIDQFPNDLRFVDTRGHIYVELERWQEALQDLERALQSHSKVASTHAALARTYAALGRSELSERHRKRAEQLSGNQPSP